MEISAVHPEFLDVFLNSAVFFPYLTQIPENYVHWRETPESHIYSAVIPGVRKEEIKVEVEDSRYLIIRTEATDQSAAPARLFTRKFRLPGRVYTDGISAGYENGVLTVTVPRFRRPGFYIDPSDLSHNLELTARAA